MPGQEPSEYRMITNQRPLKCGGDKPATRPTDWLGQTDDNPDSMSVRPSLTAVPRRAIGEFSFQDISKWGKNTRRRDDAGDATWKQTNTADDFHTIVQRTAESKAPDGDRYGIDGRHVDGINADKLFIETFTVY